jgi:hypothetical protein
MHVLKPILVLAFIVGGYKLHAGHVQPPVAPLDPPELGLRNGFTDLPVASGSHLDAVVIFVPRDPAEDVSRRSNDIAEGLARQGIPITRLTHVSFMLDSVDGPHMQRIGEVMNGDLPVVLIRGRGKANPGLDEVVAEYNAGKP